MLIIERSLKCIISIHKVIKQCKFCTLFLCKIKIKIDVNLCRFMLFKIRKCISNCSFGEGSRGEEGGK